MLIQYSYHIHTHCATHANRCNLVAIGKYSQTRINKQLLKVLASWGMWPLCSLCQNGYHSTQSPCLDFDILALDDMPFKQLQRQHVKHHLLMPATNAACIKQVNLKLFAKKHLGSGFPRGRDQYKKRLTMSNTTLMPGLTPWDES